MEYIVSLFPDEAHAAQAVESLRAAGLRDNEYDVKTHKEYTHTVKGWLERLFSMPEPLSGMEAEGVPHDDARWYEDRIKDGETMIVVRAGEGRASEIVSLLQRAGAHHIRRYPQRDLAWTTLSGPER